MRAAVPGKPDESELLARVLSHDKDELMPPPKSKKQPLTAAQIATLRQWIAEGADYEGHWSFLPLSAAPPPAVKNAAWVKNGIDNFVRAKLEKENLAPSPLFARSHGTAADAGGDDARARTALYATVAELNHARLDETGDPEILTRINAYEMAFRMQTSAPELMDLQSETPETLALYGVKPGEPSFAANCLLARRLAERGVRFIQLYHTNWDSHGGPGENLNADFEKVCAQVDQASAALVLDLKQRGLLDDTLVIWGGEFGRTPMGENRATIGRDHHVDAFTMWLAGGGTKPGLIFGETDELGFGVVRDPVHVHDLHATLLHQLGFDHERLTDRFQGRDFRLTDVHGQVVKGLLA